MDLAKLNSATKYPSILTYHEMGERGRLKDVVQVPFPADQPLRITEKVDGANGRVVILPDGPRPYIIGSREEFLFAKGDLIWSTMYEIKATLEPIAEHLGETSGCFLVFFFEVYGAVLPAAKQYTNGKSMGARLFDVATIPVEILEKPIEQIASWRDHGGQTFLSDVIVGDMAMATEQVQRVHSWFTKPIGDLQAPPTSLQDTYEWLKQFEKSHCDLGGGQGRAEGVVVRTADRKTIAKIRFEDYERTLGVKRK